MPLRAALGSERAIAADGVDTWPLELPAGDALRVLVTQRSGDVSLTLEARDGKTVASTNLIPRESPGSELLLAVVDRSGDYELRICAGGRSAGYRIEQVTAAPASERERLEAVAEAELAQAVHVQDARDEDWGKRALDLYDQAIATLEELDLRGRLAIAESARITALTALRRHQEVTATAEDVADRAIAAGMPGRAALALQQLEIVHLREGRLPEARAAAERALELANGAGDTVRGALIEVSMGVVLTRLSDLAQAKSHLDHAAQVLGAAGLGREQAAALSNLGLLYYNQGDFNRVVEYLQQALEAAGGNPRDARTRASLLLNLYAVLDELDDTDDALDFLHQAEQTAREAGLDNILAMVHSNLGFGLLKAGRLEPAGAELQQALRGFRTNGDRINEADMLLKLGMVASRSGDSETAEQRFAQALEIQRQSNYQLGIAFSLLHLGEARVRAGRLDDAEQPLRQALALHTALGNLGEEAEALVQLALLERARGNLEGALAQVHAAIGRLESVRARVMARELRTTSFATVRKAYDLAVALELALAAAEPDAGHAEQALRTSEQARAHSLMESLAHSRIKLEHHLPPDVEADLAGSFDHLSELQRDLVSARASEPANAEQIEGLEEQLRLAVAAHQVLEGKVRAADPAYAALRPVQPAGLEEARELLPPKGVLLEYHLAETQSTLFAVTAQRFEVLSLPPSPEIRSAVEALRREIAEPGRLSSSLLLAAHRAYQLLIAPAADLIGEDADLLIVPDGALHALPFEVLLTRAVARPGDDESLPFLLRRHTIRYAPSLTTLAMLRNRERREPVSQALQAAIFADVAVPVASSGAAAPPTSSERPRTLNALDPSALKTLPYSGWEARQIAALFPADRVALFTGKDAQESTFKRDARVHTARILHLATHAAISDRSVGESALLFSWPAVDGEDGLLQTREIFDLDLNARLVVLSGCETGLGRLVRGEGLVGLSQAFFGAGADELVVSLWPVADRSTAELMVGFYRQLLGGETDPAVALRKAQLQTIDRRKLVHPYFWAPFVVIGTRPLDATSAREAQ